MYTLTPAMHLVASGGTFSVRLNGARFESGNGSLQADVGGVLLLGGVDGAMRAELSAAAGALWYRDGPADARDAQAGLRLHGGGRDGGAWFDGGFGAVAFHDENARGVGRTGIGGWRRVGRAALQASVQGTAVGSIAYGDAEVSVRWDLPRVVLDLSAGRRLGERAQGVRGWVEGGATLWATRRVGLVAAGGSYPADVSRGAPGGRYAALAARISTSRRFTRAQGTALARLARLRTLAPWDSLAQRAPAVELRSEGNGRRVLLLRLAGSESVSRVEVMGTFSDWAPVVLTRQAPGVWRAAVEVAPGIHRFNVRLDGGAWTVPYGVPTDQDEFGGVAALLVVR